MFGLDPAARGRIELAGEAFPVGDVAAALRRGIGFAPEDRKRQGLALRMNGRENISLTILDRLRRSAEWLDRPRERATAEQAYRQLSVRAPSIETPVASLSGGNKQKIVIAKWLARELTVLIVDEPTRGVDVGAKAAIHALLDELAGRGVAVLLISSELPEVLNLATRVVVMREGRVAGELPRAAATPDAVLRLMAGQPPADPRSDSTLDNP